MKTRLCLAALWLAALAVGAHASAIPPIAAGCIGCHAPAGGGQGMPQLTGRSASEITAAMEAFRTGSRPATVMDRISKGFTPDEIAAIAAWYAAQR